MMSAHEDVMDVICRRLVKEIRAGLFCAYGPRFDGDCEVTIKEGWEVVLRSTLVEAALEVDVETIARRLDILDRYSQDCSAILEYRTQEGTVLTAYAHRAPGVETCFSEPLFHSLQSHHLTAPIVQGCGASLSSINSTIDHPF